MSAVAGGRAAAIPTSPAKIRRQYDIFACFGAATLLRSLRHEQSPRRRRPSRLWWLTPRTCKGADMIEAGVMLRKRCGELDGSVISNI